MLDVLYKTLILRQYSTAWAFRTIMSPAEKLSYAAGAAKGGCGWSLSWLLVGGAAPKGAPPLCWGQLVMWVVGRGAASGLGGQIFGLDDARV
jgi:hypothetical protein